MSKTLLGLKLSNQFIQKELVTADNISFTLNRGETIGIVGVWLGKSITSLSAMRLVPNPPGRIANGEILFHQKDGSVVDLVNISEKEMRAFRGNELAMIFRANDFIKPCFYLWRSSS